MAATGRAVRVAAARAFAAEVIDNPDYRTNLKNRILLGTAHPSIEKFLLELRFGKPADEVLVGEIEEDDLSKFSTEDLLGMIKELETALLSSVPAAPSTNERANEGVNDANVNMTH